MATALPTTPQCRPNSFAAQPECSPPPHQQVPRRWGSTHASKQFLRAVTWVAPSTQPETDSSLSSPQQISSQLFNTVISSPLYPALRSLGSRVDAPNNSACTWGGALPSPNGAEKLNALLLYASSQATELETPCAATTVARSVPSGERRNFETFYGHVRERHDAMLLVEACVAGVLKPLKMVPAAAALRSGSVLVFAESPALTRWRDGSSWSPSRIHGAFLLYREVEAKNAEQIPFLAEYQKARFSTTSFRPKTQPVLHGFAKTTISVTGSDGNRYRVISYFFPGDVAHLYGDDMVTFCSPSASDKRCVFPALGSLRTPSESQELTRFTSAVTLLEIPLLPPTPPASKKRGHSGDDSDSESSKSSRGRVEVGVLSPAMSQPTSPPPCSIQFLIS
ncbi:Gti1/Pac2 family-domain-containing protein [Chytriomyces sp. MP71]|nr:Gti1/Pac2 family-domain-containing protein [Chytriomyces sp. MP71]